MEFKANILSIIYTLINLVFNQNQKKSGRPLLSNVGLHDDFSHLGH